MVVFTCNNCGESLQKPRVAKHYQFQCFTTPFLTCVDCLQDFRGEQYVAHRKCKTEAERYGGKDYVPKSGSNKGEQKQQGWLNVIQGLLDDGAGLSTSEERFLTTLLKYDNLPRKKNKFLNFTSNALGGKVNQTLCESMWIRMETAYKQALENSVQNKVTNTTKNENENMCKESKDKEYSNDKNVCINEAAKTNLRSANGAKKIKKRHLLDDLKENGKKRKNQDVHISTSLASENQGEHACDKQSVFDWRTTIIEIIRAKKEILLYKLQKKIISQYIHFCGNTITNEKAISKFNKKLKKIHEIVIVDEKVTLA